MGWLFSQIKFRVRHRVGVCEQGARGSWGGERGEGSVQPQRPAVQAAK